MNDPDSSAPSTSPWLPRAARAALRHARRAVRRWTSNGDAWQGLMLAGEASRMVAETVSRLPLTAAWGPLEEHRALSSAIGIVMCRHGMTDEAIEVFAEHAELAGTLARRRLAELDEAQGRGYVEGDGARFDAEVH